MTKEIYNTSVSKLYISLVCIKNDIAKKYKTSFL